MGRWTKRKADEHQHDMPKGLDREATVGDIWMCNCGANFAVTALTYHRADPNDQRERDWQTAQWERV